jgi:rhodanese-related sulfurtransferase
MPSLKVLRATGLVESRREGKYVSYRLAAASVSNAWVNLRGLAEERIAELQVAIRSVLKGRGELRGLDRKTILQKARKGEIVILDVRPEDEFAAGHLKCARSLPLAQLRKHRKDIPRDVPIAAHCRRPFCMMAAQAVELIRKRGIQAFELDDGVAEWKARGLPVESAAKSSTRPLLRATRSG